MHQKYLSIQVFRGLHLPSKLQILSCVFKLIYFFCQRWKMETYPWFYCMEIAKCCQVIISVTGDFFWQKILSSTRILQAYKWLSKFAWHPRWCQANFDNLVTEGIKHGFIKGWEWKARSTWWNGTKGENTHKWRLQGDFDMTA